MTLNGLSSNMVEWVLVGAILFGLAIVVSAFMFATREDGDDD